jgi:hypothetical protein
MAKIQKIRLRRVQCTCCMHPLNYLARIIRIVFFIKVGWYYPGVAYLNWLGMSYILWFF